MATFALRITCSDRPGTLGGIASALGAAGFNIVALEVVERGPRTVVDHLVVEARQRTTDALVAAVEQVPGAHVESAQAVQRLPRRLAPLDLAAALVRAADPLQGLVDGLQEAFDATWCVAVQRRLPQPAVLAASPTAPSLTGARTPWLPAGTVTALTPGAWTPPRWSVDASTGAFALVPLACADEALLLARPRGPAFRRKELHDLEAVAAVGRHLLQSRGSRTPC
jgi:hypothetical protein